MEGQTEMQALIEKVEEQNILITELNAKIEQPVEPPKTTHEKYLTGLEKLLNKK